MSLSSAILASEVLLADAILCLVYNPTEQTRRIIQSTNGDKPLRDSWLYSTSEDDTLFVFRIGVPLQEESEQLDLDVPPTEKRAFSPRDIYHSTESWLKLLWNQFLSAVASRVVDDIVLSAPSSSSSSSSSTAVYRMRGSGFVMGHRTVSNEWTVGWEYRAKSRPLVHTHLQLLLSTSSSQLSFIIHPMLTLTPYLLLTDAPSPPNSGDPLTLLPFGTPAYFLHTYTASTSAVTAQFRDAFKGLGIAVGDWEAGFNPITQDRRTGKGKGKADTSYVIAYIPIRSRTHGQSQSDGSDTPEQHEKGLTIIYPSRLCMVFVSPQIAADAGRVPLPQCNFPALPAPLQPSPLVPPMYPPCSNIAGASNMSNAGTNALTAGASTPTAMATPFSPGTPSVPRSATGPGPGPLRVSTPVGTMTMGPQTSSTPVSGRDANKFDVEFGLASPWTPHTSQTQQTLKAFRNMVLRRSLSGPAISKMNNLTSSATPQAQGPEQSSSSQPSTPSPVGIATAGIGADARTLHHVARQVSDYVDAVARERDKERERMRQQQQQSQSGTPTSSGTVRGGVHQPSASASTSLRSAPAVMAPIPGVPTSSSSSMPFPMGILPTGPPGHMPPSMPSGQIGGLTQQQLQNFYPSPPQTNPPSVNSSGSTGMKDGPTGHIPPPLVLKNESLATMVTSNPPSTPAPLSAGVRSNTGEGPGSEYQQQHQGHEMMVIEQEVVDVKMDIDGTPDEGVKQEDKDKPIMPPPASNPSFNGLNESGVFGGLPGMGMGMDMDNMMGMGGFGMMGMNGLGEMDMGMDMNMNMNMNMNMDMGMGIGWGDWSFDSNNNNTTTTTNTNTSNAAVTAFPTPSSSTPLMQNKSVPLPSSNSAPSSLTHQPRKPSAAYSQSTQTHHPHPSHPTHTIVPDFEADFTEDDFDFFDKPSTSGGLDFGVGVVDDHSHLGALAGSASAGSGPGPPGISPGKPQSQSYSHTSPAGFGTPSFHSTPFNAFHAPGSSPPNHSHPTHMQTLGHPTPISTMPSPWPLGSAPTPGAAGATPSVQGGGVGGFMTPGQTPMMMIEEASNVNVNVEVDLDVRIDNAQREQMDSDVGMNITRGGKFSPIIFGRSHHEADGKYRDRTGKFSDRRVRKRSALPSPSPSAGSDDEGDDARIRGDGRSKDKHSWTSVKNTRTVMDVRKPIPVRINSRTLAGWQNKYNRATDPRFGVVERLKSRKRHALEPAKPAYFPGRKVSTDASPALGWPPLTPAYFPGRKVSTDASPALGRPPSTPTSIISDSDVDQDDDAGKDDSDSSSSDNEEEDVDDANTTMTDETPLSRPTTPPPSYLPLGPSLLQTGFKYAKLLPLSVPLRGGNDVPVGSSTAQNTTANTGGMGLTPPVSVPTPVSPAAAVDDETEKLRSFEAAAEMVAREVVDNCVWADAWRCSDFGSPGGNINMDDEGGGRVSSRASSGGIWSHIQAQKIWPADVLVVKHLLNGVRGLEGPLTLGHVFEEDMSSVPPPVVSPPKSDSRAMYPLDPPMITIGKGDVVIQVAPTALRFWEKLGLGPREGRKDVTAFVLFEDDGEWRQQQVEVWLSNLAALYRGKNLGDITPGRSSFCQKDGIVPLRFDPSFYKNLVNFVASLPTPQSSLVFFLITPLNEMNLSSSLLQRVLCSVKQALETYTEAQIVFQFIPETLILGSTDVSSPQDDGTPLLCCSIYNRILHPVDRSMSRRFFENGERIRKYFQAPAYTLARVPSENKVTYSCRPNASLDVLDRHLLLHVGYQIYGKWLFAACVDQRGEAHDVGIWSIDDVIKERDDCKSNEEPLVSKVWDFAMRFAEKANVEWRVAFAKLGTMRQAELDGDYSHFNPLKSALTETFVAWSSHLSKTLHTLRTGLHVSILCVEPSTPWIFLPESPKPISSSQSLGRASSSLKPHSSSVVRSVSSSSSKSSSRNQIFVDMSTTMYALFEKTTLPLSAPPTLEAFGLEHTVVTDHDSRSQSDSLPLLPLHTSMLIRTSSTTISFSSLTSPAMLHIHLLYAIKSPECSYAISDTSNRQLHRDITYSYHGLTILSVERWHLNSGKNSMLPFHLAAVEAMKNAIHGENTALDVVNTA
ncbi:hypothetical protein D9758_001410 [Tetrapyrgos nigripes]|uniref:Mediator of RNA polymerase II transcription subunit 13 n=1 Tax=Tetrapyrgos nigripes TaxID=182062 RepID=A0A8H5GS77_9AGAR|nr:hypothetical protein D9758_001410 [Tetrapyrgos nigripes]